MARQSLPRSALSEPENFIAELWLRRLVRRHRWLPWSAAVIGLVGAGTVPLVMSDRPELTRTSSKVALPETRAIAPLPTSKVDLQVPARTAEPRRILEAARPIPERVVDMPLPHLSADTSPAHSDPDGETGSLASGPWDLSANDESASGSAAKQTVVAPGQTPKPAPTDAASEAKVPSAEMPKADDMIRKADQYLGRGQSTIARFLYEEAYKRGDIHGAIGLAKSYDAAYLKTIGLRANGDSRKSTLWYRRAAEMSSRPRALPQE